MLDAAGGTRANAAPGLITIVTVVCASRQSISVQAFGGGFITFWRVKLSGTLYCRVSLPWCGARWHAFYQPKWLFTLLLSSMCRNNIASWETEELRETGFRRTLEALNLMNKYFLSPAGTTFGTPIVRL